MHFLRVACCEDIASRAGDGVRLANRVCERPKKEVGLRVRRLPTALRLHFHPNGNSAHSALGSLSNSYTNTCLRDRRLSCVRQADRKEKRCRLRVKSSAQADVRFVPIADIGQLSRGAFRSKWPAPLYRCYWCLQRASAKAPQKNIAPSTAANQAGGPWSGGLLKMLIAPTQSATPMPRQVNRRIYFHTIIAASKALFTCPRK